MHLADPMDHAGVEQNALGERRLAGIDVRGDADVARALQRERAVRRVRIRRSGGFVAASVAAIRERRARDWKMVRSGSGRRRGWPGPSVGVVALLDRAPLPRGGVLDLVGEGVASCAMPLTAAGVTDDPAHGERHLTLRRNFDRHLVGGATDAAALHFQARLDVLDRAVEHVRADRRCRVPSRDFLDRVRKRCARRGTSCPLA